MGRAPRIEYAGALYHVMSRGNRQETIYRDGEDCQTFLDCIEEVCGRTGWIVHAYVLMGNHYHLLLETPEPNLVDGMRWLQGTYTKRFNARHKLWGHLLQGRYKALVISPEDDYFRTVGDYIHLNPARARCFDPKEQKLQDFRWSSYSAYLTPELRPSWLDVNRVFGSHGLQDSASGRLRLEEAMHFRVGEIMSHYNPTDYDKEWKSIRKGWAFGDKAFKDSMQDHISGSTANHVRSSYSGNAIKSHDQHEANKLLQQGMKLLSITSEDLPSLKKSDSRKKAIAWMIRSNTSIRNQWISENLHMGSSSNLSHFYREVADAEKGELHTLKSTLLNNRTDT